MMRDTCLNAPNSNLGNIEGAHRVHGWTVPLRVVNTSIGLRMAILNPIGEPTPYVQDLQSNMLRDTGALGGTADPLDAIALAAGVSLSTFSGADEQPVFLDIGAQLGYYSLAFAARGFRVLAIEPMTQNVLAFKASLCMNAPSISALVTLFQAAAISPKQRHGSCAVYSPFRPANDFGNGKMECVNRSGASQCSRRHNGETIRSNFTYFFHYRRFCQQISPLSTLDDLLPPTTLGWSAHELNAASARIVVIKLDVHGAECEVLQGATRTIFHRLRPTLMLVNVRSARSDQCARALAAEHRYSVRQITLADADRFVLLVAPSPQR